MGERLFVVVYILVLSALMYIIIDPRAIQFVVPR